MEKYLLHGTLYVMIYEIDKLQTLCGCIPIPKTSSGNFGEKLVSKLKKLLLCQPKIAGSKLYATVDLEKARAARTRLVEPQLAIWNEPFHMYCAHNVSNIIFTVKYDEIVGATLIGRAYVPVKEIINGNELERWVRILDKDSEPIGRARIHVKLRFFNATLGRDWSKGIGSPQFEGVPYTFFKQRRGCKVSLYQDAHVSDHFTPNIVMSGGQYYEPRDCWDDIYDAITGAKHLIYITGWSVYANITLIRDDSRRQRKSESGLTLGEILKRKADNGVRVLMLVWDDRTSVEVVKKDGLMATHDQETEAYFQSSKVHCVLCPRRPDDGKSMVQGIEISAMFTHHQKTIVVDTDSGTPSGAAEKRRIMSFVGGIDLCDGRYDTQDHNLFGTLSSSHKDDFRQPNFKGSSISKGGPREPWHDIHCRLEGPAAWDVFYNFEQRWRKQVGDEFLISHKELDEIIPCPSPDLPSNDPESWTVQIFRSIDGGAVSGFPEIPHKGVDYGLISGKDNTIERSIQDAYIHAIRRAKNFIYIENQYFIGSSFGWMPNDIEVADIGALHLIPREVSLKVVSKIEAGERFSVYIVIPMWPEGIPNSASVQAILDWQRRTMEVMYSDICSALKAKGIDTNPRDYLSFFCLGNRETKKMGEYIPPQAPLPNTDYSRAQQSRRFMIYVHAKTIIVDDEYIIVGSANINQRSMDGARDSEIAMGGFQPNHLATASQPARGQIHAFRMALWYEHLQLIHDFFLRPECLECIQMVNRYAEENWEAFSRDTIGGNLQRHLMRYPVEVTKDGKVTTLPRTEFFPDTEARILGTKSSTIPPILTT